MKPIRWWPAVLILILSLGALGYVWLGEASQRQDRNVGTIMVAGLTAILLFLWLAFFSRLRWRVRLAVAAVGVVLAAAAAYLVRIEGVTGDWVPILAWRWQTRTLEEPRDATAAPVAVEPSGDDFPQFLGPGRNAEVDGIELARDWSARPPELVWRREVGRAWSGFAVVGGVAVTQEQRGPLEMVVAYELESGQPLWHHGYRDRFETTIGGTGPRATPTIDGGRVYTLGAEGHLACLDLATGEPIWERDVLEDHDSPRPQWGKACSPLLHGDLVVVTAGGTGRALVAYDRATGEPRWAGGDDLSGYSSPLLTELAGVPQIVIFNRDSVSGHDPADGHLLWQHDWPSAGQPTVAQPLPLGGDRLLVSSGYGVGAKLFEIERRSGDLEPTIVWQSPRLKAKFSQMVEHEGFVYGLDDGVLVCLDPATGERCWKRGRYGHGQILLVGDLMLVQTEDGELVLVEPVPEEHRELARLDGAVGGKGWNTMALAGDLLLIRTEQEAACYRLPTA
jgi:outer membrane protein assembly factor BamB